mgnify:CR=1 FL=1
MIDAVSQAAKTDAGLAALLDEAREYAQIYLLAKDRKKGCEGTGELVTLREEFSDELWKLVNYCREKGYSCDVNADDPDAAARELTSGAVRR